MMRQGVLNDDGELDLSWPWDASLEGDSVIFQAAVVVVTVDVAVDGCGKDRALVDVVAVGEVVPAEVGRTEIG
ncbi:hypothetical protein [Streptomyces siamensis]|uniref:hypothetical protein n=1 Tax=Streptomyces siamensis TaxID=1274986 RepID=UPI0031EF411B